jgi:hypothetical protein
MNAGGPRMLSADDVAALLRLVSVARSWHDFHHGSTTVQCDEICEALPAAERALWLPQHKAVDR